MRVCEGVRDAVAVTDTAQLIFLGVPLIGPPFASRPFRTTPVFVIHAVSLSAMTARRSMLPNVEELPAGHSPALELAVSTTPPAGSIKRNISFELFSSPEKIRSAGISETVVLSVRSSRKYPPAGIVPLRAMFGLPSSVFNIQPVRLTALEPGLYNSIHSSAVDAIVPAQATSLMRSVRGGKAVPAGEDVAVIVGEGVFVEDDVGEGV